MSVKTANTDEDGSVYLTPNNDSDNKIVESKADTLKNSDNKNLNNDNNTNNETNNIDNGNDEEINVFDIDDSDYLWCYMSHVSIQGRLYFNKELKIDETQIATNVASFNLLIKKYTKNGITNHRIYVKTYNAKIIEWLRHQKVGTWIRVDGRLECASGRTYVNASAISEFSENRMKAIFGETPTDKQIDWDTLEKTGKEDANSNNQDIYARLKQIKYQSRVIKSDKNNLVIDEDDEAIVAVMDDRDEKLNAQDIQNIIDSTHQVLVLEKTKINTPYTFIPPAFHVVDNNDNELYETQVEDNRQPLRDEEGIKKAIADKILELRNLRQEQLERQFVDDAIKKRQERLSNNQLYNISSESLDDIDLYGNIADNLYGEAEEDEDEDLDMEDEEEIETEEESTTARQIMNNTTRFTIKSNNENDISVNKNNNNDTDIIDNKTVNGENFIKGQLISSGRRFIQQTSAIRSSIKSRSSGNQRIIKKSRM